MPAPYELQYCDRKGAGKLYRVNVMKYEKLFPTILILLDLCAAIGYMPCGDWRKVVYWIAAAVLTFCVTY
ncbi:MAG: hypothetical protein ACIAQZ_05730 [Sedimentisphaeraceae bacterium JB056]